MICGDSKKSRTKCRGYIYRKKDCLYYSCHNCNESCSFSNFLKRFDNTTYNDYKVELFKGDFRYKSKDEPQFLEILKKKPVFDHKKTLNIPSIESLPSTHPAKIYLTQRQIPKEHFKNIFFADDFHSFTMEMLPENDKNLMKGEQRIVFPYYDEKNNLLGFQGRAIYNSEIKYITIKASDDARKIYGLDKIDLSKKIYVVEGPIDSLFLHNAIAMMESALYNVVRILGDHDYVFCYDNQPRNVAIVRDIQKTIEYGKDVCIWPENIQDKDINDMVLSGLSSAIIQNTIDRNTFTGLRAKLEFEKWKKI